MYEAQSGRVKFESLLAEDALGSGILGYKSAQASDDTQFTQDFSNLAFTFIQDRAPALMDYILGFELVDREPDGTKAVGVFGFKVGDDYYYAPAFFMNNQVKGVDLLLSKKTNSFVPLTDDWVGFIVNRAENKLGEGVDATAAQEDFENPDFEFLRRPTVGPLGGPATFKSAEDKDAGRPWSFARAWRGMHEKAMSFLEKDAEYAGCLSDSLSKMSGARVADSRKYSGSPVKAYLEKVGGPEAARTLSNEIVGDVKFASALLEFYSGVVDVLPTRYGRDCLAVKKAQEKVEVDKPKVLFTDRPDHVSGEDSARDIVENGFAVVDRRGEEEKSSVVEMNYEDEFSNPDVPGTYDVLLAGGAIRKADVLDMNRVSGDGSVGGVIVMFHDNGQAVCARKRDVIVHGGRDGTAREVYAKASPLSSMRMGERYVLVGPDGSCIGVLDVHGVSREKDARPVVSGYLDCYCGSQPFDDSEYLSGSRVWSPAYYDRFELADFEGSPTAHGRTLVIPSNWRALDAGDKVPPSLNFGDDEGEGEVGEKEIPESKVHTLGSMVTLESELRKAGAAPLDVRSDDGSEYYWSFDGGPYTAPVSYKQASVAMVAGFGLGYGDARRLLKSAASGGSKKVLLKMAQAIPGQFVGVGMGEPPQQTPGADPYTGIPVYGIPYEDEVSGQFTGVPSYNPENVNGENIGGEASIQSQQAGAQPPEFDQEAAQLAQDAAASGQKEVFDLAAIGGLAKVYDTGDVVDSYLPEFMQALDRLGRTLFLYFWKHDDFVERYGTDKVVEMEDLLRSTFKQLGSLTLDLRKKAVGQGDGTVGSM